MRRRRVLLIVNPRAGGGRARRHLPAVEAAFRRHGVASRTEATTSLDHARALAREATGTGEVAAAMGGDGLIAAVAGELTSGAGVLGVVPAGRGNDFARKLGIPLDPAGACAVIAAGTARAIDAAKIGDRVYLGIAGAGIDSDVQVIANATRLPLGGHVYAYGTLRALASWKPAHWDVWIDGGHRSFTGYSVAVANTGVFGGGMYLVPGADVADGLLDVVLSEHIPKHRYLLNLPRVFKGTHVNEPGLHILPAREVRFAADRPFPVFADGDAIGRLPATARVLPGAVQVLAP